MHINGSSLWIKGGVPDGTARDGGFEKRKPWLYDWYYGTKTKRWGFQTPLSPDQSSGFIPLFV